MYSRIAATTVWVFSLLLIPISFLVAPPSLNPLIFVLAIVLVLSTVLFVRSLQKTHQWEQEERRQAFERERLRQAYLQTQFCPYCHRPGFDAAMYCVYCNFGRVEYNMRIAAAKGWRLCPSCQEPYDPTYYCTHCGFGKDDFYKKMAAVDYAYRHGQLN